MTTNVLIIFGYCFIFELFILVSVVFSAILRSIVDKKAKENTYKYMIKNEEKLRKQAQKEKAREEKIIDCLVNIINCKDNRTGKIEVPKFDDKKENIEFKIIALGVLHNNEYKEASFDISEIVPNIIMDDKTHLLKATIQIDMSSKTGVHSPEFVAYNIDLRINPYTGEYINNSDEEIKMIKISSVRKGDISEEERKESDYNKKLTTSPEAMNELLENAISEGYTTHK